MIVWKVVFINKLGFVGCVERERGCRERKVVFNTSWCLSSGLEGAGLGGGGDVGHQEDGFQQAGVCLLLQGA